jgi:pSer/pThr/pTyr-binding forkhead associated (FHA) protein/tetratricopeptide (TPR) repeat protein
MVSRLTVRLFGEKIHELPLEHGREYIAGRAADADIPLNSTTHSISRHHLKFYEDDGHWVCELLSKFTPIQQGTETVPSIILKESTTFAVAPYEFTFEADEDKEESRPYLVPPEDPETVVPQPRIFSPPVPVTQDRSLLEPTRAGIMAPLVPHLMISYPDTDAEIDLILEGNRWQAGRSRDCNLRIKSPHISGHHFEIAYHNHCYFITELGSSNGTALNGRPLAPNAPESLESGDRIQIEDVKMTFELRDRAFQHQFAGRRAHGPRLGPWIFRAGFAVVALYAVASWLDASKLKHAPVDNSPNNVSFEKLTPEQRASVKDSFTLARNLYVQGKYEICLTELAKVHELIPQYENSKELQSFCEQGNDLVGKERDNQRKESERQRREQQIAGYVESCQAKLKDQGSVDEIRSCLAPAMELDPQHASIVALINAAQAREEDAKSNAKKQAETEKAYRAGVAHFKRAKSLLENGSLSKALGEFEKFLRTPYPRSDENKSAAQREIASIRGELQSKVESLMDQCRKLGSNNKFKEAYLSCEKALSEDPGNKVARAERDRMMENLKRELKSMYEDSALEENMGNVDSAKEKWKRILKEDVENGEYAKKASSKLQKYGTES